MAAAQLNGSSDAEEERPSTLRRGSGEPSLGTNADEVTRRALLGAALGVPLISDRRGASIVPNEFDAALSTFHTAQAEVRRIEAATAGRSAAEEEAWLPRHDAACEAMEDALARTLAAPAPDLPAFAAKLDLFFAHAIEPGAIDDDVAAAILVDAGRLLVPG
jgi:hypothetical protein